DDGAAVHHGDVGDVERVLDPDRGTTSTFEAYRASQLLVRVGTARPGLDVWVSYAVVLGPEPEAMVRYHALTRAAEPVMERFARSHRPELERDLALFARQEPERGRYWGPRDETLLAFRAWIDGFAP
ncbi:MAG: hypothetical protein AAGK32_11880, partial [Actinomycetota bacterium]